MQIAPRLTVAIGILVAQACVAADLIPAGEPLLGTGWQPSVKPLDDTSLTTSSLREEPLLRIEPLNFGALVSENIFVWGDRSFGQVREEGNPHDKFSADIQGLGLGLRAPLLPAQTRNGAGGAGIDFVGCLSVERLELGFNDARAQQDLGYGVAGGLRAALTPQLELNTGVKYSEFGSVANSFKYTVGSSFNFTPELSVNLDYARNIVDLNQRLSDDLTQLDDDVFTIGFRYLFGKPEHAGLHEAGPEHGP